MELRQKNDLNYHLIDLVHVLFSAVSLLLTLPESRVSYKIPLLCFNKQKDNYKGVTFRYPFLIPCPIQLLSDVGVQ